MRPDELSSLSLASTSTAIAERQLSPVEVVEACLTRISSLDPLLRSYITVLAERAVASARQAESEILRGNYRGALHGIPLAVKDNIQTAGTPTTCGSRLLAHWVPSEDATVIRRLADAGAILLGKLNMHEFAFRVVHPDYPPPRNPWNLERSCAGSSSGSAAAVAATLCLGSLGTDTGGSIRIPAAYCGVVGFKPTYGLVSRAGVIPLSWTLDHVGPLAKRVEDAAIMLDAVAGPDPTDPGSVTGPTRAFRKGLARSLRSIRVGILPQLLRNTVAREVQQGVRAAADVLRDAGMTIQELELPGLDDAPAVQRTIIFAEAAAYHQKSLLAQPADYSQPLREQLALGLALPATQYLQAQRLRRLITGQFLRAFRSVDLLVCPAAPVEATPLGQQSVVIDGETLKDITVLTRLTNPFNVTGLPAITVPCGFSQNDLPLGVQLIGRPFEDDLVLAAAHTYEQSTPWHRRTPSLAGRPA